MLSTWKIAPALAAGCTVVHKPAEFSPLTASILWKLPKRLACRPGSGTWSTAWAKDAGKALTEHPAIKAIALSAKPRPAR